MTKPTLKFKCRNHSKKEGFDIGKIYEARRKKSPYFHGVKTFEVYSPKNEKWYFLGEAAFGKYFNVKGLNQPNPYQSDLFQ